MVVHKYQQRSAIQSHFVFGIQYDEWKMEEHEKYINYSKPITLEEVNNIMLNLHVSPVFRSWNKFALKEAFIVLRKLVT